MKRPSSLASPLYPKIRFAFTDHPITVWAGAIVLRLYFEFIGLRAVLPGTLAPLAQQSNNQIPVSDVLLAWFYGLALGPNGLRISPGSDATPYSLSYSACPVSLPPTRSAASFSCAPMPGSRWCLKP
jgi:hypothetical protein